MDMNKRSVHRGLRRLSLVAAASALMLTLGACSSATAPANESEGSGYPERPVQFVVGFNAGGALDLAARELVKDLPEEFRQSVVVNQAGDGGVIAASDVFGSPADGYKAYFGSIAALAIQPWRSGTDVPYGGPEDYTPVANVLSFPQVLAVPADAPYDTPQEFVDYAREHPGKVRIGTGGAGTLPDIALQQMIRELNLDITDVPFQGFAQSVPALLSGSIEGIISSPADVAQHVEAGNLKVLGSFNADPIASMPDVESFTTAGMDYTQDNYYFVALPPDAPKEVVDKLASAVEEAVGTDEFKTWADQVGATVQFQDAEELGARLQDDYDRYEQIVSDLGL